MSRGYFTASRADGRSDRQVVYELARDIAPGGLIAFDALAASLAVGVDTPITRMRACAAARQANRTLLRNERRCLRAIPGEGYRILEAAEHMGFALTRKERGLTQLRRGVEILQNTRLDELSEAQRRLHEGWTLAMSGVMSAVAHTQRKVNQQESIIATMCKRLDTLEADTA